MPDDIRKKQELKMTRRDFEFMPATLEVLERPPAPFSRAVVLILILLSIFAITWSFVAQIDIVAIGTGVVVPKGRVKVVQSLESGIVTEIKVSDGQLVEKGELLVKMDSTESLADLKSLKRELLTTQLAVSRLDAQLACDVTLFIAMDNTDAEEITLQRRLLEQSLLARKEKMAAMAHSVNRVEAELKSVESKIGWLKESLPLAEKLYDKKRIMAEQQMLASGKYLQAQMEINEVRKNLAAEKNRMKELELSLSQKKDEKRLWESEYKKVLLKELTDARKKISALIQHLAKAKNKFANRELRSPINGIVQQLAINTIGGVVTSAQTLMTIVPMDSGLEIEAKLLNKDIGFVSTGQYASVKVAAYPFTRHGDLAGNIEWVGRDAVMDEHLGPVYPIRISVNGYQLPNKINGKQGVILPGMTVTTDINVGKRRVIHYFLGPILRYKDQSLREL